MWFISLLRLEHVMMCDCSSSKTVVHDGYNSQCLTPLVDDQYSFPFIATGYDTQANQNEIFWTLSSEWEWQE